MKKKAFLLFGIFVILLSGCGNIAIKDTNIASEKSSAINTDTIFTTSTSTRIATSTPSPTDTLIPTDTHTPLPTIDKHPPTPTVERSVEWDIEPFIEKRIDTEWKGVRIKASFIIDASLKDRIKSMEILDSFFADLVARTIFIAWYIRHNPSVTWAQPNYTLPNRVVEVSLEEYHTFLDLWSQAQRSGKESDWRNVQINSIWTNDLSDGNGYVQRPYNFWPMYEGSTPSGVTAMSRFTIVLTDFFSTSSIVRWTPANMPAIDIDIGYGFNLDNGDMMFYIGHSVSPIRCEAHYLNLQNCLKGSTLSNIANIGHQLALNRGESSINYLNSIDDYIALKFERYIDIEFIID